MRSNRTSGQAEAAVEAVPDLSPAAIERLGLTVVDLDRLGLSSSGRVADAERAALALAELHAGQAESLGWLGLDDAVGRLAGARAERRAEAARHLADPGATSAELSWALLWGAEAEPAATREAAV